MADAVHGLDNCMSDAWDNSDLYGNEYHSDNYDGNNPRENQARTTEFTEGIPSNAGYYDSADIW